MALEPSSRKTIDKAMQILHLFSNTEPELSLTVIADRLGMHKSVASRLVSSLCEWRMLERDGITRHLRLGMGAWHLGMLVGNQNALNRAALPVLGDLVEQTRHSAYVAVLDRQQMLVVATVQSPDALRVTLHVGDYRPLHATAGGKLMLAHMSDEAREQVLGRHPMPRLTRATITSVRDLEAELAQIRRSGIAWNDGESAQGVGGLAAGIFDRSGAMIGTLSSVYPQAMVADSQRSALAGKVRKSAAEISGRLGWTGTATRAGK